MEEAFPLYWPEDRTRTPHYQRHRSRFQTNFTRAINTLNNELRLLGARNVVISTDIPLRKDGKPYATTRLIEDPGAAVYFDYKGSQMCFACDRWDRVWDNIYAISKTIEAIRGIERWGTGDMLAAAFTGFIALPPPKKNEWWEEILGFPRNIAEVEQFYRGRAKEIHPDLGGSNKAMAELNRARKMALEQQLPIRINSPKLRICTIFRSGVLENPNAP